MRNQNEKILTEGSIIKNLIHLSVPIILTNILQTAYNLTDTFWIIRFPLAYYLAYHTGLKETGIWISYPFTNFVTALAGIYFLIKYKWFKKM